MPMTERGRHARGPALGSRKFEIPPLSGTTAATATWWAGLEEKRAKYVECNMTNYQGEFFIEPDIIVKQEPDLEEATNPNLTASVPIPTRRIDPFILRDFSSNGGSGPATIIDFDSSTSSPFHQNELSNSAYSTGTAENSTIGGNSMWTRITEFDGDYNLRADPMMRMDEDDIFQVDKADLIQGPTLAELNANADNLLDDLNFDDLLLPGDGGGGGNMVYSSSDRLLFQQVNNNMNTGIASSCPQVGSGFLLRDSLENTSIPSSPFNTFSSKVTTPAFSPASQASSTSSLLQSTSSPSLQPTGLPPQHHQKHSALHELLKRDTYPASSSPDRNLLGQSVPSPILGNGGNSSRTIQRGSQHVNNSGGGGGGSSHQVTLSSSAPTHLGIDQIWARREPRKHLLSTGSLVEAGSTSSLSTGGILSPEGHDFSNDDDADSDEDSEHYEDFSSDADNSDNENDRNFKLSSKRERYFWQYNVQAKGPKGQRLIMKTRMEDPHVLNEVTDPVFSPNCSVRGIKHSGKARKGDGNDLTPNPRKLFAIGRELDKLSRVINSMTPVSELPFNIRPKSRKEKNKLASRACRLKKKAQHEANKIKLQGLEGEHKKILNTIAQVKEAIALKASRSHNNNQDQITQHIDNISQAAIKNMIAGNTTEYVNTVIDKVKGNNAAVRFDDL